MANGVEPPAPSVRRRLRPRGLQRAPVAGRLAVSPDLVLEAMTAGVPVIEVTHGDGLGGSSFNYGFSRVSEFDLYEKRVEVPIE